MKTVAIITRTKDRPLLLKRACASVTNQIYRDYVWVIVNDGGNEQAVNEVASQARENQLEVIVVHNAVSQGMEAASNIGIRSSTSSLIVIHDDDDTWDPQFLERTVGFLSSTSGAMYGGVITHTIKIEEEITGNQWRSVSSMPFNDWISAVYLADVATMNTFPPISFLYRRDVFHKINGYDEQLPVLGDWLFNLRFLQMANIAVIKEPLAYYHQRINKGQAAYENTVVAAVNKHQVYDAVIRNRLLREDLEANRTGLGHLVNLGRDYSGPLSLFGFQRLKRRLSGTRSGRILVKLLTRIS